MKRILITGSTDGIGKLTAIQLAQKGHEILVHGRNKDKVLNTVHEIKEVTNNDNVKGYISDLANFESIDALCDVLNQSYDYLDVLINNAGVYNSKLDFLKNGLDMRFAVNYFAPYILTKRLLSLLNGSEKPRIINLSSAAQSTVSLPALNGSLELSSQEAYAQSKLALTMWSFYLAKTHNSINVIAVNPGSLLNTNMVKEAFGKFWSSAQKGADILSDLAISEEYELNSGHYFDNDLGIFSKAHSDAYIEEQIEALIMETEKILKGL